MKDIFDILNAVHKHVDQVAEAKGFGDSYAYKFGFFESKLACMLEDVLTPAQLKKLAEEAERLK